MDEKLRPGDFESMMESKKLPSHGECVPLDPVITRTSCDQKNKPYSIAGCPNALTIMNCQARFIATWANPNWKPFEQKL